MWKSNQDKEDYTTQLDAIRVERDSIALELEGSKERTEQLKINYDANISILRNNLADISNIKTTVNAKIITDTTGIWGKISSLPVNP